jgi:hypothetical protein
VAGCWRRIASPSSRRRNCPRGPDRRGPKTGWGAADAPGVAPGYGGSLRTWRQTNAGRPPTAWSRG